MSKITNKTPAPPAESLLRVKPASERTGLSERQLLRAAHSGRLAYYKPSGPTGPVMFAPADLADFLAAARIESEEDGAR